MAKRTHIMIAALSCAGLAACAQLTPQLDASFGDAVNLARARQVMDPNAPTKNLGRNPTGLDGRSAKAVIDRYQKSFTTPEPQQNVFAIGVSGSGGSQ